MSGYGGGGGGGNGGGGGFSDGRYDSRGRARGYDAPDHRYGSGGGGGGGAPYGGYDQPSGGDPYDMAAQYEPPPAQYEPRGVRRPYDQMQSYDRQGYQGDYGQNVKRSRPYYGSQGAQQASYEGGYGGGGGGYEAAPQAQGGYGGDYRGNGVGKYDDSPRGGGYGGRSAGGYGGRDYDRRGDYDRGGYGRDQKGDRYGYDRRDRQGSDYRGGRGYDDYRRGERGRRDDRFGGPRAPQDRRGAAGGGFQRGGNRPKTLDYGRSPTRETEDPNEKGTQEPIEMEEGGGDIEQGTKVLQDAALETKSVLAELPEGVSAETVVKAISKNMTARVKAEGSSKVVIEALPGSELLNGFAIKVQDKAITIPGSKDAEENPEPASKPQEQSDKDIIEARDPKESKAAEREKSEIEDSEIQPADKVQSPAEEITAT